MLVALASGFRLHPAWSPVATADGFFKIAYDNGFDIFLVNPVDGSGHVNLTNTPLIEESHPTWSPTADRIAVRSVDNDGVDIEVLELGLNGSMLVVDGRISLILGSGAPLEDLVRITTLDWARTGDVIAFSGNGDIWVVPVADPELVCIEVDDCNLTGNPDVLQVQPSWSPDDTQIVYRRHGSNLCGKKGRKQESSITIRNLDGSDINGCEENAIIIKGVNSPDWRRNAI